MTTWTLKQMHLTRASTLASLARRLRRFVVTWRDLVARSVEAGRAYDTATTTSARHKVLTQFVDSGA